MRWIIVLAIVLVIILRLWPKGVWWILGVAAVVASVALYWGYSQEAERERIVLTVSYAPSACSPERPMDVSMSNATDKTVYGIQFSIHARVPGYSSVITPYTYKQYQSEKILTPGEDFSGCYPVPAIAKNSAETHSFKDLEWSAEVTRIYFK